MRFQSLQLTNYCQFHDVLLDFQPGVNLIAGPNGSGKSNCLKALYGALTGEFRNTGDKSANVRISDTDVGESAITAKFFCNQEYSVTRSFKQRGSILESTGMESVTKEREINSALESILGVSKHILDQYVFVDQWMMFSFLAASPAERVKFLQALFGLSEIEEVWQTMGEHITKVSASRPADLSIVTQGIADNRRSFEDLQRLILSKQSEVKAIQDELLRYVSTVSMQAVNDLSAKVNEYYSLVQALATVTQAIAQLESGFGQLSTDTQSVETQVTRCRETIENLDRSINDFHGFYVQAISQLSSANDRAKQLKTIQQREAQLARLNAQLAVPAPQQPSNYVSSLDAAFYNSLQADLASQSVCLKIVSLARASCGAANIQCPTCGNHIDKSIVDQSVEALAFLEVEISNKKRLDSESRLYDKQVESYARQRDSTLKAIQQETQVIAQLTSQLPAEVNIEESQSIIEQYEGLVADKNKQLSLLSSLNSKLASLQTAAQLNSKRYSELLAERVSINQKIDAISSSYAIPDNANTIPTLFSEFTNASHALEVMEIKSTTTATEIARLNKLRLEIEVKSEHVQQMEEARSIVHRNGLPSMVTRDHLRKLEVSVNSFLVQLSSEFRVRIDESLNFVAIFPNNKEQPAGRLSGGQKVVLALAFRLSVNIHYAQGFGLLCLDEPTVGLDDLRIDSLQQVLTELRQVAKSHQIQIIVVSHEPALVKMADHVILLGQ